MTTLTNREQFSRWVQNALAHLYDSSNLKNNPLGDLIKRVRQDKAFTDDERIRRVLLETIQAMRPVPGTPAQSPDWRNYRILTLRFVESAPAAEVMQRVSLSRSHYFSEQAKSVDALIDRLWTAYGFALSETLAEPAVDPDVEELLQSAFQPDDEVRLLSENARPEILSLSEIVEDIYQLFQPASREHQIRVSLTSGQGKSLFLDRVMVRQVVLNLMAFSLEVSAGGRIFIDISDKAEQAQLTIRVASLDGLSGRADSSPSMQLAKRIVEVLGGSLNWQEIAGDQFFSTLSLPHQSSWKLLVVDDDRNYYTLFARYLAGKNWSVIGAGDGEEAYEILSKTCPTVITLDVCMPNQDGWGLLRRIKDNPDTRAIPVIVCSVLDQPTLAQALGAETYLAKPVSKSMLIDILETLTRSS